MARSGRLIIKASRYVDAGTVLLDSEARRVARVVEVFGPVKSPYISAQPLTDRVKKIIGSRVYIHFERRKR